VDDGECAKNIIAQTWACFRRYRAGGREGRLKFPMRAPACWPAAASAIPPSQRGSAPPCVRFDGTPPG
jgi:hypothetical protein